MSPGGKCSNGDGFSVQTIEAGSRPSTASAQGLGGAVRGSPPASPGPRCRAPCPREGSVLRWRNPLCPVSGGPGARVCEKPDLLCAGSSGLGSPLNHLDFCSNTLSQESASELSRDRASCPGPGSVCSRFYCRGQMKPLVCHEGLCLKVTPMPGDGDPSCRPEVRGSRGGRCRG